MPISGHNDWHFSANGFVTMGPIAMYFLKNWENVSRVMSENFAWIRQILLHEINDDVQTWFWIKMRSSLLDSGA